MILDLHRHLQRHRLRHQTPQLIAARLIANDDLDHCVGSIDYEGQWLRDGDLAFVGVKRFIEPCETVRLRPREFGCTVAASLCGSDLDCQRNKTIGNRLAVHVQAGIDLDIDRQPQSLEGAIGRRVKTRCNPNALGLRAHRRAVR